MHPAILLWAVRRAEQIIDCIYTISAWLRENHYIGRRTAAPSKKNWRKALKAEWRLKTKCAVRVTKRRHTPAELLAIFASLRDPNHELYRSLLNCAAEGAAGALPGAKRSSFVLDEVGRQPTALRLHWTRKKRNGATASVSGLVHLDVAAIAHLRHALVDGVLAENEARYAGGEIDDYALFPESAEDFLGVDPRVELAVELGGELRLGQVLQAKRTDLELRPIPDAAYGQLTVNGNEIKPGETVVLSRTERDAVDRALSGHLAECESQFNPTVATTNYYLFPGGKLVRGRAVPKAARRGCLTRSIAGKKFHQVERAAGVVPQPKRGWYGIRHGSTDVAPGFTSDARVLDRLGGWTPGSETRQSEYLDSQNTGVARLAAGVRERMRSGGKHSVLPSGSVALADLPDDMRRAVEEHLRMQRSALADEGTPTRVGTSMGTNRKGADSR